MSPFNEAWALLKQQNYSQTALPGMTYNPEFDMRYYFTQDQKTPQVSHIGYNPSFNEFTLRGENNEPLSTLYHGSQRQPNKSLPSDVKNIEGQTNYPYQRQGYYGKLMQGLLNAGINVLSDSRNDESQPFHEKFQDNLTPNLDVNIKESPRKLATEYNYFRKPIATFGDSDLAQRDYGSIPIKIFDGSRTNERIGTRQTDLADFDPAFRQWELEQEKLKEEARQKSQLENIKHMNRVLDVIMGRIPKSKL